MAKAGANRKDGAAMNPRRGTALLLIFLVAGCRERHLPHEGKSVAELEAMLRNADPVVQSQGAFGLSLLGSRAQPAVPSLVSLLRSPQPLVRQNAALALGKIGPEAR